MRSSLRGSRIVFVFVDSVYKDNGDQRTDKDLQVVVKNGHGCACSSDFKPYRLLVGRRRNAASWTLTTEASA
jgi:hypothetical protein